VTLRFSTAPAGDGTAVRDQYTAGRDQVVAHGQVGEVLAELASLREALAGLRLTEAERSSAERDLQAMEEAVGGPEPDARRQASTSSRSPPT
jgi:hypothetical protein